MSEETSGFWANATEPKRKYRFTLDLNGLPRWVITGVDRPSFKVSETTHVFYNHKFHYPGKVEWQQLKFTCVDPINPDATALLMKMVNASGYIFPNKQFGGLKDEYMSMNKVDSVDAVGGVAITSYDGTGRPIEKWKLHNAFIVDANMGSLKYDDDTMLDINITLRYDWATLVPDLILHAAFLAGRVGAISDGALGFDGPQR